MTFRGGTMLDALNAVARARGDVDWKLGYAAGPLLAELEFGTRGTQVVRAPVAIPQSPR
jgi:hypothetical protein